MYIYGLFGRETDTFSQKKNCKDEPLYIANLSIFFLPFVYNHYNYVRRQNVGIADSSLVKDARILSLHFQNILVNNNPHLRHELLCFVQCFSCHISRSAEGQGRVGL